MIKKVKIKIFGRVQGVWFRESAKKKARQFNIAGRAGNEPDGSVCIEAQGEPEAVEKFIKWCRQGPELARVERIEVAQNDNKEIFAGFKIRR